MTEKKKKKAYDEALERAKKFYGKIIAEEIFPGLKESEDERIKKAIIEFFESEDDNTTYSLVRKKDIIAWLEKQGKKSTDKWISVEKDLPKQDEEVIVLCDELNTAPCYKIAFGHIVDKTICKDYNGWNIPNVVYWFPMPKLPKE